MVLWAPPWLPPAAGMCVWCRKRTRTENLSSVLSRLKWRALPLPTSPTCSLVFGTWWITTSPHRYLECSGLCLKFCYQMTVIRVLDLCPTGRWFILRVDEHGHDPRANPVTLSWGRTRCLECLNVLTSRACSNWVIISNMMKDTGFFSPSLHCRYFHLYNHGDSVLQTFAWFPCNSFLFELVGLFLVIRAQYIRSWKSQVVMFCRSVLPCQIFPPSQQSGVWC